MEAPGAEPAVPVAQMRRYVERRQLKALLGCACCESLLREAFTVVECMHKLCGDCLRESVEEGQANKCPVCQGLLGVRPLEDGHVLADREVERLVSVLFPTEQQRVAAEAEARALAEARRKAQQEKRRAHRKLSRKLERRADIVHGREPGAAREPRPDRPDKPKRPRAEGSLLYTYLVPQDVENAGPPLIKPYLIFPRGMTVGHVCRFMHERRLKLPRHKSVHLAAAATPHEHFPESHTLERVARELLAPATPGEPQTEDLELRYSVR
mmetsp:Transcript_2218/g.7772  ORF Transcript_2218/g.7772 Transcript_2218/m.7772 type:complete len:268 (+) Transcript_2218:41-844(+)